MLHFKYTGSKVSGHGNISLYIHITLIALVVMRTDTADQQNIVVEPQDGLKTLIFNLAVSRFSKNRLLHPNARSDRSKVITELHYGALEPGRQRTGLGRCFLVWSGYNMS